MMPHWHGERWWHEDRYRCELRDSPTLDGIDRAIERVAQLFDERWVASSEGHPAICTLWMRGTMPLEFLYELGSDLLVLKDAKRLPSILHDLKQASHYSGVRFELEIAALLRRSGFDVEFRPPAYGGRFVDLVARRGAEESFFELKLQQLGKIEVAADILREQLMFVTSDVISRHFAEPDSPRCAVELFPEALAMLSGNDTADRLAIGSYVRIVRDEILRRMNDALPIEILIPAVASVRIGSPSDQYSGIRSPLLPPELELKRIMRGSLKEATDQLAGLCPAIMIIKTASVLAPGTACLMMTEWFNREEHTTVEPSHWGPEAAPAALGERQHGDHLPPRFGSNDG